MNRRPKVLVEGDTVWRVGVADRLAFLIDPAEYFAALREALLSARQSVMVIGWVIDSRLRLVRDGSDDGYPAELADLLIRLVEERPDLSIRILVWDHSILYTFDREFLTRARLGWMTPERLQFELDGTHPPGASHHEKLVVIDDQVAFIGGIDLGRFRWDTSVHQPGDDRRTTPAGDSYGPFHDLQTVVDGEVAHILGDHARTRWELATGQHVEATSDDGDPWPRSVNPAIERLDVGVVRTRAEHEEMSGIRETESIHLRMIENAKQHIYIENQYLTAGRIGKALADRLAEHRAPEVLAVTSRENEGWLERVTMGGLRARWCREMAEADGGNRLGVYCPVDRDGGSVMVHSKLMIADDQLLYHGSANLSNRSMVLDSECGLALAAGDRKDAGAAIRDLRRRLLAEHLDTTVGRVADEEQCGSIKKAVEVLSGSGRTLEPLSPEEQEIPDALEPIAELADPAGGLNLPGLNIERDAESDE